MGQEDRDWDFPSHLPLPLLVCFSLTTIKFLRLVCCRTLVLFRFYHPHTPHTPLPVCAPHWVHTCLLTLLRAACCLACARRPRARRCSLPTLPSCRPRSGSSFCFLHCPCLTYVTLPAHHHAGHFTAHYWFCFLRAAAVFAATPLLPGPTFLLYFTGWFTTHTHTHTFLTATGGQNTTHRTRTGQGRTRAPVLARTTPPRPHTLYRHCHCAPDIFGFQKTGGWTPRVGSRLPHCARALLPTPSLRAARCLPRRGSPFHHYHLPTLATALAAAGGTTTPTAAYHCTRTRAVCRLLPHALHPITPTALYPPP